MLPPRIHLPSNGSHHYFPNNTSSNFTVKVSHLFNGKVSDGKIECALSQIIFPNTYRNVRDGLNGVIIYHASDNESETVEHFQVPPGYYSDIKQLLHTIRHIAPPLNGISGKPKVSIGYHDMRRKCWVNVSKTFYIEFQFDIARLLGFEPDIKIKGDTEKKHRVFSTYHAGVHRELSTIFVYCDIIQHQLIAETSAPLLRILNWNHTERTQNISQTFSELFYVPLKAYDFDTIHIYLLDSMGYPISFEEDGHTYAVLEFREIDS